MLLEFSSWDRSLFRLSGQSWYFCGTSLFQAFSTNSGPTCPVQKNSSYQSKRSHHSKLDSQPCQMLGSARLRINVFVRTVRTEQRTTNTANKPNYANNEQCEQRTVHFFEIVEHGHQCEQVRTLVRWSLRDVPDYYLVLVQ